MTENEVVWGETSTRKTKGSKKSVPFAAITLSAEGVKTSRKISFNKFAMESLQISGANGRGKDKGLNLENSLIMFGYPKQEGVSEVFIKKVSEDNKDSKGVFSVAKNCSISNKKTFEKIVSVLNLDTTSENILKLEPFGAAFKLVKYVVAESTGQVSTTVETNTTTELVSETTEITETEAPSGFTEEVANENNSTEEVDEWEA